MLYKKITNNPDAITSKFLIKKELIGNFAENIKLIENAMKQSRFIGEIMVIGDGEKMPGAFIQLDFDFVRKWANKILKEYLIQELNYKPEEVGIITGGTPKKQRVTIQDDFNAGKIKA